MMIPILIPKTECNCISQIRHECELTESLEYSRWGIPRCRSVQSPILAFESPILFFKRNALDTKVSRFDQRDASAYSVMSRDFAII